MLKLGLPHLPSGRRIWCPSDHTNVQCKPEAILSTTLNDFDGVLTGFEERDPNCD